MTKRRRDPKLDSLQDAHAVHARAVEVSDDLFKDSGFFDPRDVVQVKYEMLRRVRVDQVPVARAARAFGFSRPAFYQAQAAFARAGLLGLLPQKRGPRRAHKLAAPVLAFVREALAGDPTLHAPELSRRVRARFDVTVHPRSIERALERTGKGSGATATPAPSRRPTRSRR